MSKTHEFCKVSTVAANACIKAIKRATRRCSPQKKTPCTSSYPNKKNTPVTTHNTHTQTHTHTHTQLDGDIGTIGITAHAAGALGDIVYVDLPSVGAKYSAGDSFGSVESVKAASDVYAPVAGEVLEVNAALEEAPGKVNESPIEGGWFIKLKVSAAGKAEFEKLLDEKAYKAHCDAEKH